MTELLVFGVFIAGAISGFGLHGLIRNVIDRDSGGYGFADIFTKRRKV